MRAAAVAGLLALGAATPASAATYAVAIGNNEGHAGDAPLAYADRDAEAVLDVLRRLSRVGPEDGVLAVDQDAESVRGLLLRTNARIREAQQEGGPQHTLIVYYSGHADADALHLGTSTLRFSELKTIVESSPARVRILILDACRSGGATRAKGVRPAQPFQIHLDDRVDAQGMAIITSSADSEDSQESDALRASFFTHHLVNGLRGAADKDRDAKVTLGEAYGYAFEETLRSTGRTLALQHPTYLYDLRGAGEVVLAHLSEVGTRSAALAIRQPGAYLIFEQGESGPLAADITVSERGADMILPPGKYFVQRRGETTYREVAVELAPGARAELERLPGREVAYARLVRKGGGQRSWIHAFTAGGVLDGGTSFERRPAAGVQAGYAFDLEWLSAGAELRWSRRSERTDAGALSLTLDRTALRVRVERCFDLSWATISAGLFFEGVWHHQGVAFSGLAPERNGFGVAAGLLAALEVEVTPGFALRLEGGPMTEVYRRATLTFGAVTGDELATPLTYTGGLGVVWRR